MKASLVKRLLIDPTLHHAAREEPLSLQNRCIPSLHNRSKSAQNLRVSISAGPSQAGLFHVLSYILEPLETCTLRDSHAH
jgi:hypothetical protein